MKRTKNTEKQRAARFSPLINAGLDNTEVAYRKNNGEINKIKDTTEKTYLEIIFKNIFSFFNILMAAIAVILMAFVGVEVILNLSFILLAIVNTLIGTIQECKSKAALKKLKLLSANKTTVIREWNEEEILSEDIVLDDILVLSAGDQIPVDSIIAEDKNIEVDESLLTGESRAVKKSKGDKLFAGSFVISGKVKARADAVGKDTYIHSLEMKTKAFKKAQSKLMVGITRIIKMLTCIAVPLAIIVLINQIFRLGFENYKDIIKNSGLIIPYMIPAGMLLLSSVSMMKGVVNLSKKNVLAQDLSSVEALSRVDTICLDKTGTLTDGTMTVEKTIINGQGDIEAIISSYMGAFETSNQTSNAIIARHGKCIEFKASEVLEFSSARKYSAVRFENGDLYALGAPEYLMPENEDLMNCVKEHSKNGSRVIALVKIILGKIDNDKLDIEKAEEFATFIIRDNIRSEVPAAMEWFNENGVNIKVISGDNVGTVSYIAKHSGIKNWDKAIDMSTLDENADIEMIEMSNTVFARVTPEQKAEIVDILKKNGRNVAMLGDGINDIVALKKADCAIALANGSQATKNVCNLLLMDSNFANMKEAVFEGRRVVNNVQRSSTLFVMKDFLWMFITIWPILFGLNFDLEPTVMTTVNMFITGIGSLFLALEPDRRKIEGDFIKNVIGTGIVSGFYMFLPVVMVYIYASLKTGFDIQSISEMVTTTMFPVISICITIAGFIIFAKICKPFTRYRKTLYFIVLLMVIGLLILIPDLFLKNGTDFMAEIIALYGTNIADIIYGIFKSILSFSIYKALGVSEWVIICIFLILSTTLYKITDRLVSRWLKITMFNPNRFDD